MLFKRNEIQRESRPSLSLSITIASFQHYSMDKYLSAILLFLPLHNQAMICKGQCIMILLLEMEIFT